jgi:hypothetical protein
MGIGLFMAIMDVQIVTSSLSQIWAIGQRRRAFSASSSEIVSS